ncbi:hypothetical protein ONZ45_g12078 [Pleurotus djamor]|nr:hypothetical protein ONZ45_g12078 [Pleurotus djamor]
MANVIQSPIGFQPRPVGHSPSPLGFGFGLTSHPGVAGWPSTSHYANSVAFASNQFNSQSTSSPSKSQKRRHEPEEADERMDRSPTPERPTKRLVKRLRPTVAPEAGPNDKESKENKAPSQNDDNDVDVGLLLASLPPQSLLPILNSLIRTQPSIKSLILPLIPRPTLETANQALAVSAKKLRDAYPYHNPSPFGPPQPSSPSLGFGFGNALNKPVNQGHGMRDSYILSRLTPHMNEFVSAAIAYLPYFSYVPRSDSASSTSQSHSTALQVLHKDKAHPSETFSFLSSLTHHMLSQPELTQSILLPNLLPRVVQEWKAWVDRVDETVNRQGGMFGRDTVVEWERTLDEYAIAKGPEIVHGLREVRDQWISKVGWLVGRQLPQQMME